ncbi:MAG: carboxypeptidase-like regulatory domain-containing protein [Candidatus Dormiibacterota bacterium]
MRGWKGTGLIVIAVGSVGWIVAPTQAVASSHAVTPRIASAPNLANYVPLDPFRILDTRAGTCVQCGGLALGPGMVRKLQLSGVTGLKVGDPIPPDATAVVLNVTEVAGTAQSLLTVFPYGGPMPHVSNLNFGPGTVIPNLVTATMGTGGAVNIYNALGTVNVVADVEGYFEPAVPTTMAGEFHAIAPVRVCDTRSNPRSPGCNAGAVGTTPLIVNVTGTGSDAIPVTGAEAAVLNLTGVAGTKPTYLSVFPTTSSGTCAYNATHPPPFSTLNLGAGQVEANRVMVQLGPAVTGAADTSVCVYNAVGTINVVLDANGWFGSATAPQGAQYQAITPTRICDTRTGSGLPCAGQTLNTLGVDTVVVAGEAGLPATTSGTPAVAFIANLTAIAPTQATYLTLYPANQTSHSVSDINLSAGEVLPNLAVVQVDTTGDARNGDVDLFNAAGVVNAAIDIEGWFQLTYTSGIDGTVMDSRTPAQPVQGATVAYTGILGTGSTTTDNNGDYALNDVQPGTYVVTVSDYGYTAPSAETVTVVAGSVASASLLIRDPFLQPFTSASIWNTPIGSGAVYAPANLIAAQTKTLVSDQHIIVMTPSAPPTNVYENTAGPHGSQGQRCDATGAFLTTVPIPADFVVPSTGQNDPLTAVAPDGQTLIQGEPFARCTAGGPGTLDFFDKVNSDLFSDGLAGWDGGSHLSALGGAIRLGELVPGGVITHALQIDVDAANLYPGDASTLCNDWPATKCDKNSSTLYTGTNANLRMGSLLALPSTLDLSTLNLMTPAGMILAKAFQDYGAYIANTNGIRSVNNIVTELSPSGSILPTTSNGFPDPGEFQTVWGFPFETASVNGTDPWSQDIATIFAHLDIVTNNGPTSIGGGGTPLAPLLAQL